jgi:[protein-PII] uridylyltransferase
VGDALKAKGWDDQRIAALLARGTPSYWLAYDTDAHVYQAELLARAAQSGDKLAIDTRQDSYRGVTEVTVYTADHPGLFSRIAGGIALARANIVEAKIFTLADGMALDTFLVQDTNGEPIARKDQIERLTGRIEKVLTGNMRVRPELERNKPTARTKVFAVAPRVLINNKASRTHTLVEVNGRDRPGLLFELTAALFEMGLQISSAMIFTYGERAVDVFYVKDVFGFQVTHEGKLDGIRTRLIEVLAGPEAEKAEKKAPARRARAR